MMKNRREITCFLLVSAVFFLLVIIVCGLLFRESAMVTDFSRKNLPPCIPYPFGTDWMGRDMFLRTVTGLSISICLGMLTAGVSALIAFILGISAAVLGKCADLLISGLIDLVMGIPHILLLILVSYGMGKGFWGVVAAISLTHWTSLARLIRGEVLQIKESQYIKIAQKFGNGRLKTALLHMTPHLVPQLLTGMVLMFPHAILHEASITFLGFGLSLEQPAVGVILSESMKHLAMGKWWLALFPGLFLVLVVMLFHWIGESLCRMIDPGHVHQ